MTSDLGQHGVAGTAKPYRGAALLTLASAAVAAADAE